MRPGILIVLITITAFSCSDDPFTEADVKGFEGIWVPYELILTDGTVNTVALTGQSFFGAYDESLKLLPDGTYVPLLWRNKDDFYYDYSESGTFSIDPVHNVLSMTDGRTWNLKFKIVIHTSTELWLDDRSEFGLVRGLVKLRKMDVGY
jgi:hypothetical protein